MDVVKIIVMADLCPQFFDLCFYIFSHNTVYLYGVLRFFARAESETVLAWRG